MNKIISVIKREYLQIVRTKGFIIGTVLGPVIMAAFIVIPIVSQLAGVKEQEKIGVIDLSREIFSELERKLDLRLKSGERRYILKNYEAKGTAQIERLRDTLRHKILEKELSAYLLIPEDIIDPEFVFELEDGSEVAFSELWMVNFENSGWDFPGERYSIKTSATHIFLRDGSLLRGDIKSYLKRGKVFRLEDGSLLPLEAVKRIYFSKNMPPGLKETSPEKELSNGQAAFFLRDGSKKTGSYAISRHKASFVSEHVSDFEKIETFESVLNNIIIEKRLRKEGLDPEKISQYMSRVGMKTIKVTKKGEEEEETGGTFFISYFLVMILYITMFFYGAIIMRGVIEEKSSRVIEIVISSLRPFQLMMGKMLGIAAVGFTQYAIWAVFGFSAFRYSKSILTSLFPAAAGFKLPTIPPAIFFYFIIFFILGYFLYGTLYAAIGSMVNSEKEAQQLLMPVTFLLVGAFMVAMVIIRSPNSSLAVTFSLIPFFAPILMFMRICILMPPFSQIAISIFLLVLTTLFMIWLVARIYRVGILMYGKPPSLREVVKWLKYG